MQHLLSVIVISLAIVHGRSCQEESCQESAAIPKPVASRYAAVPYVPPEQTASGTGSKKSSCNGATDHEPCVETNDYEEPNYEPGQDGQRSSYPPDESYGEPLRQNIDDYKSVEQRHEIPNALESYPDPKQTKQYGEEVDQEKPYHGESHLDEANYRDLYADEFYIEDPYYEELYANEYHDEACLPTNYEEQTPEQGSKTLGRIPTAPYPSSWLKSSRYGVRSHKE